MLNKFLTVSVIIPVYNGIDFIDIAIKSIINQDYNLVEIIVVNDGSTDGTKEYLDKLIIKNLVVIHTENKGQSSAINTGVSIAKGDIVGYLSADDIFNPKLLNHIVNEFIKNPKAACVFPDYNLINQEGIKIKSIIIPKFSEQVMFENLYCYPGPGAFFYKSHFLMSNGFDTRYRQIPDFDFWVRLINYGQFIKIDKELASFRVHDDSASVRKISKRRSNEIVYFTKNITKSKWNLNKTKANAYLISAFYHLKSDRFINSLEFIRRAINFYPKILFKKHFYRIISKGFLKNNFKSL